MPAKAEDVFLKGFIEGGVFSNLHFNLVRDLRKQISEEPKEYLKGLFKFFETIRGNGLGVEEESPGEIPIELYVARLLAGPKKGVGLNVLFSPGDQAFEQVRGLYNRNLEKLDVDGLVLPFDVFWADGYYYRGSEFFRGEADKDMDSGWEVFELWDQTWSMIQTHAAIFRLGAPEIPVVAEKLPTAS